MGIWGLFLLEHIGFAGFFVGGFALHELLELSAGHGFVFQQEIHHLPQLVGVLLQDAGTVLVSLIDELPCEELG